MTDKVQKIREEVERLMNELIQEKKKGFGSDTDDACILELQNVLTYIDFIQKEPVSEDLDRFAEEWDGSLYRSDAVKAGAHWLLNKLMNKAINTTVVNDWTYGKDPDYAIIPAIHLRTSNFTVGDTVRVLIVKEKQI